MTTRTKYKRGLEKDPNSVYVGRRFGPFKENSKWANPFIIGKNGTREEVIAKYRTYLLANEELISALPELRETVLICWCKQDELCHADVLIELIEKL